MNSQDLFKVTNNDIEIKSTRSLFDSIIDNFEHVVHISNR